ncbi:MAG: hypothetical protein KGI67_01040 [Pseudomonadota bacterium]|nr:hypothetical protein [Pseudomonadota bacterium]
MPAVVPFLRVLPQRQRSTPLLPQWALCGCLLLAAVMLRPAPALAASASESAAAIQAAVARSAQAPGTPPAAVAAAPGATGLAVAEAAPLTAADRARYLAQGRRLYRDGVRHDGSQVQASRVGAAAGQWQAPACVSCHRPSGMGTVEGNIQVPPINGRALFAGERLRERVIVSLDPRRGRLFNPSHAPYDAASLLQAVAAGVHVSGRAMNALMPRYAVDREDIQGLMIYLSTLSDADAPGDRDGHLRFATVITPEVTPERRAIFLENLRAAFDQKEGGTLPGKRHMASAAEMIYRTERHWDLDEWQLSGPASEWMAQMDALYARQAVFALVSGLGEGEWSPVQAWCEARQVPCWFPSVTAPPPAGDTFYSLYFSRGVLLEADVMATTIGHCAAGSRVVQWVADDAAARAAAARLAADLAASDCQVVAQDEPGADDILVLWQRADGLAALGAPPAARRILASGQLAGDERAPLPAAWRPRTELVVTRELPARRGQNLATLHSWLAIRGLALRDEALQSEVFFAFNYLQNTLTDMLDNVYRDFLVERGESMLNRREAQRAEEETITRMQGHPPAPSVAAASRLAPGAIFGADPDGPLAQRNTPAYLSRSGTTIYPHLGLAPGQRFASRGAYLVRLSAAGAADPVMQASAWIVPDIVGSEIAGRLAAAAPAADALSSHHPIGVAAHAP